MPTPKVNSCGGCVNRVSITIAYDSESSRVISKASPFIKLISKCCSESHNGSDWSSAVTFHWNVGLIHNFSMIGMIPPEVSTPQPSPWLIIPSMVKATDKSSSPSPSISM